MSWIEEAEEPDIPAIFRSISIKPHALEVVERLNEVLSFGNSGLSRTQEEAIATVVSVANRCRYGAMTHAGFFRRHSRDPETANQLLHDYTQAELAPADRQMLDFAVRVTQEPDALTRDDLQKLRDVGLEEPQILAIVLIACLCNFMDRLANSLGVDLPPRYRDAVDNWLTGFVAQQGWLMHPPGHQPEESPGAAPQSPTQPAEATGTTPQTMPRKAVQINLAGVPQGAPDKVPAAASKDVPEEEPGAQSHDGSGDQNPDPPLEEASALPRFIEECCLVEPGQSATARDLYIAYLRWCDDNDHQPLRQRDFGMTLTQLGYCRQRRARGRHWWTGIGLETVGG